MALHFNQSPEGLDEEAVKDYLFLCKSQHQTPSESFFKHTVYGLRTAYKVLGLKDKRVFLPQIKAQRDLPVVLNRSEVRSLLKASKYLRHRLMLGLLYGCGLRSYELCKLRLSDLDFERKTVFVRKGKGHRDRYLPLSAHLIRGLRVYFQEYTPQEYVFISQVSKDGKEHPITTRAIQWLIKESRSKVKTSKHFTAHTLRHSYATHLLEDGVTLLQLQQLLGHSCIENTIKYLHVCQLESPLAFSPLDSLLGDVKA